MENTPNKPEGSTDSGGNQYLATGRKWASEHPYQVAGFGAAALLIAAPGFAAAPVLGVLGFGANGIVGGSIAAGAQSAAGNVVAGSVIATLQSAGAGGYGATTVCGIVQGTGVLGAAGSAWSYLRGNKETQGEGEDSATENNKHDDDHESASSEDTGEPKAKL
ncbi:hypothetical protein BGZ63DRAFT_420118 [Mariannaea sp. PMI_226]|nr:hypothetical protein BGZ63DRAFT_420118 [Mariannaea sp. PMI_226]